jgi:ribosome-binding factor A
MAQVDHLLQREIGDILIGEVSDSRLAMFTVTGLRTGRDLGHARVYVTYLGEEEEVEPALQVLRKAAGHIRKVLGGRIHLKRTPALEFFYDESTIRGTRILTVLREMSLSGEIGPEEEIAEESGEERESDKEQDMDE